MGVERIVTAPWPPSLDFWRKMAEIVKAPERKKKKVRHKVSTRLYRNGSRMK